MTQKRSKTRKTQQDKSKETKEKKRKKAGRKQKKQTHTHRTIEKLEEREEQESEETKGDTQNQRRNPSFRGFFQHEPKYCLQKPPPKKKEQLLTFFKTEVIQRNRYVATPVLDQKLVFVTLHSLGRETLLLQETTKRQMRQKAKIRTRVLKEKRRQETRKERKD